MMPRLALNQATTEHWTLAEAVHGCAAAGIEGIGLWRNRVEEVGVDEARRIVDAAGLTVTSLCRGGFFTAPDGGCDDNRRAVDEAAALGTGVLVLVCGGVPEGSRDLDGARARVSEGIAELAPYAAAGGVRLAVEPMHPMFCSDRGVVSTLGQALDLALPFPAEQVGVVVDTYHVWWDPQVFAEIMRCTGRIASVQASDWITPLPAGALLGRGHVGDGCIDVRRIVDACYSAGFDGFCEVEVFNEQVWGVPGEETLATVVARHAAAFA